jgi:hypothetical protein
MTALDAIMLKYFDEDDDGILSDVERIKWSAILEDRIGDIGTLDVENKDMIKSEVWLARTIDHNIEQVVAYETKRTGILRRLKK